MAYITLDEAKAHLRVDYIDDDLYITSLIDLVESLVRTEITGTIAGLGTVTTDGTTALVGYETNFTDFAINDEVWVEGETSRVISAITNDESLSVSSAFSTSASALVWVVKTGLPLNDAGTDVVPELRQAMLLMMGHFYANRESVIIGVGATEIPLGFKYLIAPFKNYTIA